MSLFTRGYAEEELLSVFGDQAEALTREQLRAVVTGVVEIARLRDISVMGAVDLLHKALHPQTLTDYADTLTR